MLYDDSSRRIKALQKNLALLQKSAATIDKMNFEVMSADLAQLSYRILRAINDAEELCHEDIWRVENDVPLDSDDDIDGAPQWL